MCDKQQRVDDSIEQCSKALELRPHNVKALFRRGKAFSAQGKLDEAMADLKAAQGQDPDNVSVKNQLALVRQKQKQQDNKDKKVFGKMFAKPGALSPKAAPAPARRAAEEADAEAEAKQMDDTVGVGQGGVEDGDEGITELGEDTKIDAE